MTRNGSHLKAEIFQMETSKGMKENGQKTAIIFFSGREGRHSRMPAM